MLKIAVVAYNYEIACKAVRLLAENDVDSKPKIIHKDKIIMEDETQYVAFPTYNHVRGHCIDQVVIVDDFRWSVDKQQIELLDWIRYRLECTSCVPEELQELRFEW